VSSRGQVPSAELLREREVLYRTLLEVTIPGRYAGSSGRYHGTDTARKNVLRTRVLPDLRWGRLPSAETHRALTLGRYSELSKMDQKFMVEWKNKVCPDPRTKKVGACGLVQQRAS
jgi:hypothetical protein